MESEFVTVVSAMSGAIVTLAGGLVWGGKKLINVVEKNTIVIQSMIDRMEYISTGTKKLDDAHAKQLSALRAICTAVKVKHVDI